MSRDDALRVITTELQRWGYSMTDMPKYITLEQALRIVGATP